MKIYIKTDIIERLSKNFEDHSGTTENCIEFWIARDLQHFLSYTKWDNFVNVIIKAKTAFEASEKDISNHSVDVNKMVDELLTGVYIQ